WLDGWIALEFLRESQRALTLFSRMHDVVKFPVSRARAAYWAARAASERGNSGEADRWLRQAAAYPTTFYGQLAASQLHRNAPLALPSVVSSSTLHHPDLMHAITLLIRYGDYNLA